MNIEEMLKSDDTEIVQLYSKIYLETHSIQELDKELENTVYDIFSSNPLVIHKSVLKLMAKYQKETLETYRKSGYTIYGKDKTDDKIQ